MVETFLNVLRWSWNHPDIAGTILSGAAFLLIIWLHIPSNLVYYWQSGQITTSPFNVRNEIPQYIHGRINVLRFSQNHEICLALGQRVGLTLLEFFLKVIRIPDPQVFAWEHWFGGMMMYPLGHSRREYLRLCIDRRMWPWKRADTLQRILDKNKGCLRELQEATVLSALTKRLRSHA